jgi:hypothetical protein
VELNVNIDHGEGHILSCIDIPLPQLDGHGESVEPAYSPLVLSPSWPVRVRFGRVRIHYGIRNIIAKGWRSSAKVMDHGCGE